MAFGLIPDSGSAQLNGEILGGLVTGSNGEFLALPISSTQLGGFGADMTMNEWSRFYLSDSFGTASGSIIQALNYLSASISNNAEADVEGPASSNDNAVVRFDGTSGKIIQNTSQILISDAGDISSSQNAHFVKAVTGLSFAASSSVTAKTTISGAGALAAATLETEEATITVAGVVSGAGAGQFGTLVTEEATISVAGVVSGAGAVQGASLTVSNLLSVNNAGVLSSSKEATLGTLILNDAGTDCLLLSGSMTGSGLATFTNTTVAQGGGYKPAIVVSSSAISTAADAAAIPRLVLQGTDNLGVLSDFIISVSGGMLKAQKLTPGTWPL